MPSLPSQHPLWTRDLTSLPKDELTGYMIEARHIVALVQGELCRRSGQTGMGNSRLHPRSGNREASNDSRTIVAKLESTATQLRRGVPIESETKRLEELVADRLMVPTLTTQPLAIQNLLALTWLTDRLTTPVHTALLYTTFSKTCLVKTNPTERSTIIKVLCDRQDLVAAVPLTRTTRLYALPTLRSEDAWLDVIVSFDNDVGNMLRLLVLWGGVSIPSYMLNNLKTQSPVWGPDGEAVQMEAPRSVFYGTYTTKDSLLELSKRQIITIHVNRSLEESYTVSERVQQKVQALEMSTSLKTFALMVPVHLFPKHRAFMPTHYDPLATLLMPPLIHALQYLDDKAVIESLTTCQLVQVAEACFSASYFHGSEWKRRTLSRAHLVLSPFAYLTSKLLLRDLTVSRTTDELPEDALNRLDMLTALAGTDKRWNAHKGELAMFKALLYQDKQDFASSFQLLSSCAPLNVHSVSHLEKLQLDQVYFRCGKLLRYQGSFAAAETQFVELLCKPGSTVGGHIGSHLAAVRSELGKSTQAIQGLEHELKEMYCELGLAQDRGFINLKAALGESHAMAGLGASCPESAAVHFRKALAVFDQIHTAISESPLGRSEKMIRLRITASAAMVFHAQGQVEQAALGWQAVHEACRNCGWREGHGDMIASLSLSEIAYRAGKIPQGDDLLNEAIRLYKESGHQYYFTGHGSLWPARMLASLTSWFLEKSDARRGELLDTFRN
ncbi:hypothetical protein GGR50DRAFT_705795 [Xylaria sp. CBS 124048]|nr:hypothetical protein GGR50DRAFT_705795 [Xylaria sp. CBS 124048]